MENNSPWRSILSIVLLIIALVRIAMFCNRQNATPNYDTNQQLNNVMQMQQENLQRAQEAQAANAPKQLYIPYTQLKETEDIQLMYRGIERFAKDTLIPFDLTTSMKLEKGTYFISRPQDPIRFGFKGTNDVITWVNEYSQKGTVKELLADGRSDLKITKTDVNSERTTQVFYTYTVDGQKFNGFGVCTQEESGTTAMLFEHSKKTSAELQAEFMSFVLTHFVKVTDDQNSTAQ